MEVLEKKQQKTLPSCTNGGSEDNGSTLTMNFLMLVSNEFHIFLMFILFLNEMSNFIRMKALGNLKVAPNVHIQYLEGTSNIPTIPCALINHERHIIKALKEEQLNRKYRSLANLRALFDVEENPLQILMIKCHWRYVLPVSMPTAKMTREFIHSQHDHSDPWNLFYNKGRKHTNFGCKDSVPLHPWDVLNPLVIS